MTTLGFLASGRANGKTPARPLDLDSLVASLVTKYPLVRASLGNPTGLAAALTGWTNQDDDAHDTCSLTACLNPLHPGPCKGWKHTLHAVSPGAWHQLEEERVRKANARRVKRIADLRAQGKPIPRRLLTEIKPKPAPGPHTPGSAPSTPHGALGQKAGAAGGGAHTAGQAVSNAAGVTPNQAPALPLGPKQKKPSVAGRGPAFVITQPKVTDTYKLDKAAKITPQEWNALPDADKTAIRNELTAIKARGFGPQQTRADALLLKLYAPNVANTAPGKVTLGQAVKTVTPQLPPPPPSPTRGTRDQNGILNKPLPGGSGTSTSVGLPSGYRITRDNMGYSLKHNGKLIRTSSTQGALEKYAHEHAKGASGTPPIPATAAPASSPSAVPKVLPPHAQAARAVAARTFGGAPTSKKHLIAYGKLSKADFDNLDATTQKTIRDDLANAKAKFLDPKKKQEAADLLDRFGSRHPAPATPATPAPPSAVTALKPNAPAHPKGYSDPMAEVIKAAQGGDQGKFLQTVARISPATAAQFDDGDRKQILSHLAFIAAHPNATAEQKAKAAAYGRIINGGTHVPAGQKFDHTPSIGELHTEEQKGGHAAAFAAVAASQAKTMDRDSRVKAMAALTKPQFDALTPDDQRKVADALAELHAAAPADKVAEAAVVKFTGVHPAVHGMRRVEADYRAGKATPDEVRKAFVHGRVQATHGSPAYKQLEKEAQRVAEDNPSLPLWIRVGMIENKYGTRAYDAVSRAQIKYNYEPAPRFSTSDINQIFRPTNADLATLHPIQAEAVKALRTNLIETGLRGEPGVPSGSPWSIATRSHVADQILGIDYSTPDIPADRLKDFQALPDNQRALVRKVLADRLKQQTDSHAKVSTSITLDQLDGKQHDPRVAAALKVAADRYATRGDTDAYRSLEPHQFIALPDYAQAAIKDHLAALQQRAIAGGPSATWTPADHALKMFPAALAAHLDGSRTRYADRRLRNASDIANYGTGIVNPYDRTKAYAEVPIARFRDMSSGDQAKVVADLDHIATHPPYNLQVRYQAQFVKDVGLGQAVNNGQSSLNVHQLVAVGSVSPAAPLPDQSVVNALNDLDKADFDKLNPVYREAVDARIAQLPGTQQQALTAKFHPAAPVVNPSGYTPTAQANVPPHVQAALDTIYGVHPKSHTMAHQLGTYSALRGSDFSQLNAQEQGHLLGDLSFIATTAKGPSGDKARKLIDRFTPPGTPSGQVPTGAVIPPANAVAGQVRYATPLKGLAKAKDSGQSGDGWMSLPGGGRVWGHHGAAGLLLQHTDQQTGEKRYLMVQRGPAISDPGKWTFPGGASDSKETPHEGATRETIEELGLKDDVFKDALVHGDHTFTVPNSSWKYTTVAASVPTMIKPNLTTAHARAETSDAKWMTLDEIRALDKAGSLHHPIAGGKLEQNVISLYPQGQTLGQVARPGPVTKRLGRLNLPSGGRQAPASFNAWPHPHKPSKGKDLIPDKATVDAQRQKIKADRKLYDGKTADGRLAAIGAQQGFDDTPTVLDKKEIDRLLATGDYIEAWRGVSGSGGYNWRSSKSNGKTADAINEEMRSGPAYYGKGIFGNGYYLATQKRVAEQYADGTKGSIARILIPKTAITKKYDEVSRESHKNPRTSKAKGGNSYEDSTFYDPGRYAAAKGVDGIEIEHHHMSPGGGARHVATHGKPAFNWLNRSVLIVQKEPG